MGEESDFFLSSQAGGIEFRLLDCRILAGDVCAGFKELIGDARKQHKLEKKYLIKGYIKASR